MRFKGFGKEGKVIKPAKCRRFGYRFAGGEVFECFHTTVVVEMRKHGLPRILFEIFAKGVLVAQNRFGDVL